MKFHFSVEYHTVWGQQIGVEITRRLISGKCVKEHIMLDTQDGLIWKGEVFYNNNDTHSFTYQYIMVSRLEGNGILFLVRLMLLPTMFSFSLIHGGMYRYATIFIHRPIPIAYQIHHPKNPILLISARHLSFVCRHLSCVVDRYLRW